MENFSHSSYPDSVNSSPRSREIDLENASWDEPPPNYKVRFMCSYGGKIHPRPHDNQLAYVGGETKILAVDRNIKFSSFMSKLCSLCDAVEVCFKYQLPEEDLDALISVTNDEDLEHMMLEYDRLFRTSTKTARLRLFIFPLTSSTPASFADGERKSGGQWFVDALNSVQMQNLEGSSPASASAVQNPDFLFGLDKGFPSQAPAPTRDVSGGRDISAGSDCGSEDRHVIGEPVVSPAEIHRQIQEMQRMHISGHEQTHLLQRKADDGNPRGYAGDYYGQRPPEKVSSPAPPPAPAAVPVPVPMPASFLPDRNLTSGPYPVAGTGNEPSVYYMPGPMGGYVAVPQGMRPVTGQAGQAFYGVQRMVVPDLFREQPVYNAVQKPQASIQQPKAVAQSEGMQMMQQKVPMPEPGFAQVMYDGSGHQVYYTLPPGTVVPPYQGSAGDGRHGGTAVMNQDGKVVMMGKGPQTSM